MAAAEKEDENSNSAAVAGVGTTTTTTGGTAARTTETTAAAAGASSPEKKDGGGGGGGTRLESELPPAAGTTPLDPENVVVTAEWKKTSLTAATDKDADAAMVTVTSSASTSKDESGLDHTNTSMETKESFLETEDDEEEEEEEEEEDVVVEGEDDEEEAVPEGDEEDVEEEDVEEEGEQDDEDDAMEEEADDALAVAAAEAKARGDVDKWVKYLDDTNPCHRLRSLCKKGDLEELTALLETADNGVDINYVSEEGWTCLHEIITHECQFTEVAKILLKFGANVNTQDLNGDSPLHSSLLYHNSENISLILEHGADFTLVSGGGRTPVHVADDVETLKLLLDHGAKVDCQDSVGNTPLHYAVVARDKARINLILGYKPNLTLANRSGSTALHLTNDSDIASTLLAAGANPNQPDLNANTPLHIATRGRHKEIVRHMLQNKGDVSLVNAVGKTPLNLAKDKEMKNILLGKVSSSNSNAVTPISSGTPSGAATATTTATTTTPGAASTSSSSTSSSSTNTPASASKRGAACSSKKTALSDPLKEYLIKIPACISPGILKRKRRSSGTTGNDEKKTGGEEEEETPKRKGPRLRFSDVNDYSGVEVVAEPRRVKVPPVYSEHFSSDDD